MTGDPGKRHRAMSGRSLLAIAFTSGAGLLVSWPAGSGAVATAAAATAAACPVSKLARPVAARSSFNVGYARIAVALPPRATFVAVPEGRAGGASIQADGWIRTKLGWFAARGRPRVSGRRIGGAQRLRADVGPLSWTSSGAFYPSLLYFPAFGCWRITATAGGARLDAVVRVVRT